MADDPRDYFHPDGFVDVLTDGRPLTLGEFEDGWAIFGDSLPYADVEIFEVDSAANFAMEVPGYGLKIYVQEPYYYDDFSKAPDVERGLFIHEMTHVFQGQNPAFVDRGEMSLKDLKDLIANGGDGSKLKLYDYQLAPGDSFRDFNPEHQATIAQDYFARSLGLLSRPRAPNVPQEDYESLLPFDQFGGERARVPVIAPINEDGSQADTRSQAESRNAAINDGQEAAANAREPRIAPINEDGSPVNPGSQAEPRIAPINDPSPVPSAFPNAAPPSPAPDAGLDTPGTSTLPNAEPVAPPTTAEPPARAAAPTPKPPAEPEPEPETQGPTLAEALEAAGEELIDPNEERAVTQDEGAGGAGNEDDDDEQGTGGASSEMPNPMDDGPSYSNGDYIQLLNRNAPYVNPGPGGGIDMTFVGDIDPSVFFDRNAPYTNPGSGDFDMPAGSTDFSVLVNRNAPYVNPGLIDIDLPVGDIDPSVLVNRNGPRMSPEPDNAALTGSTAGGLLSDVDFGLDVDDLAGFEIG
jgi:hypothetical protein